MPEQDRGTQFLEKPVATRLKAKNFCFPYGKEA